ncbi:MAG TPA: beta-propeller fold lactonase family protein [Gaiellales bacterium]
MKRAIVVLLGMAGLLFPASAFAHAHGAVFVLSNATAGNRVIAFQRTDDGHLGPRHTFATGGAGTGAGLGSGGALTLSPDGRRLYAVNAGSDTVSVFRVSGAHLHRIQVVRSGGDLPISVAAGGGRVYVLNAGATPSVVGFRVTGSGIARIHGAWRHLAPGDKDPAQVGLNPAGNVLVVTNKTSSTIDTFHVGAGGVLGHAVSHASVGGTPFGFAFARTGALVVSDASIPPSSGATSYSVAAPGALTATSGALENHQQAACWVAITPNSRFAYTANTASGTVSAYRIDHGAISLVGNGVAGDAGSGSKPADEAITPSGGILYVLAGGTGRVEAFRIGPGGSLHHGGSAGSLPAGAVGLAVR